MGSFCKSRNSGPLQHCDTLQLEHGPEEEEKEVFVFNKKSIKKILPVEGKN